MAGTNLVTLNNNSVNLTNQRWTCNCRSKKKTKSRSYYLSLTKLRIPLFPAAILSDMATITAGKPVMMKDVCLEHDSSGDSEQCLSHRRYTQTFSSNGNKYCLIPQNSIVYIFNSRLGWDPTEVRKTTVAHAQYKQYKKCDQRLISNDGVNEL